MGKTNRLDEVIARWALIALAVGCSLVLAASLETGRAHAQASAFKFLGSLSRVLTPNGDGLNDIAILCVDNPRSSSVSGSVFDLRGARVATLFYKPGTAGGCPPSVSAPPNVEQLTWDGKASGRTVPAGVYVYQIQSEGVTVTGTVVVVR